MRNPALISTIRSVGEQLLVGSTRYDLQQTFSIHDNSHRGVCPRDDFINAVFDTVRGLRAADLMKLLSTFASEHEDLVNYEDFFSLVERQGQIGGLEYQNQQMSLGKQSQGGLGARSSERNQRDVIERVKQSLSQARGGVGAFEATLRKLGGNGGLVVSQDDLTIALSRVNAALSLDDIRDFYRAVNGDTTSRSGDRRHQDEDDQ